jgi:hypothetical protein
MHLWYKTETNYKSCWTWQTINKPSTRKTSRKALNWICPTEGDQEGDNAKESVLYTHY